MGVHLRRPCGPGRLTFLTSFDIASPSLSVSFLVNVMRCSVCHQDYKQSDIIDNYFVKDTSEAISASAEKSAQVCERGRPRGLQVVLEGFCIDAWPLRSLEGSLHNIRDSDVLFSNKATTKHRLLSTVQQSVPGCAPIKCSPASPATFLNVFFLVTAKSISKI